MLLSPPAMKGDLQIRPFSRIFPMSTKMFLIWSLLATAALANFNELIGTWSTKSRGVITGPVCGNAMYGNGPTRLTCTGILRSAQ